ncbi:MAG: hypothetical protein J6O73_12745 [Lachnospiraceae bacterium]|nr:hypothetical protein [Lachnospiraceae bacterium]
MKIVYLGTDAFLACFLWLIQEHDIMALYTCCGDEDFFRNFQIVSEAKKRGIPVYDHTITTEEEQVWIAKGCELFVSADYGRKIPLLPESQGFYGINIHESLLPEGRSYCPVECAMERGLSRTGVTIHKLSEEFDCGDILLQEEVEIYEEEDSVDLYLKCERMACLLLRRLLAEMTGYWSQAMPQKQRLPYWRIEHIKEARLSHDLSVTEARRRYRLYNRMVRVRFGEKIFFVKSMVSSRTKLSYEECDLGDIRLYSLRDGHLRLGLIAASDPAVWEAKSYPFRKSGREA